MRFRLHHSHVLLRGTAQRPERSLQTLGQRREALAAENHLGMPEAGPGKPEVIQHVIQLLPGNGDAESLHPGEVRQAEPARPVRLLEHDIPIGTVPGPPVADAPLQGAPDGRVQIGVTLHQLPEHGHRPDVGISLEKRHDLAVEYSGQRVRTAPAPRCPFQGRKRRVPVDPVARGGAETGLRRGHLRRVVFPVFHE